MSKQHVLWIVVAACLALGATGVYTFFSLTQAMQDTAVMELSMPPETGESEDEYIPAHEAHTVVLLDIDDMVFIGKGDSSLQYQWSEGLHITSDSARIMDMLSVSKEEVIIVKSYVDSRYKNLVDMMDYLAILQAPRYAIDKITDIDLAFLATQRDTSRHE